jgi:DNA-binding SARP family transcriptional activator
LALASPNAVTMDQLAEALWGNEQPRTARAT